MNINRENYEKFIQMAKALSRSPEGNELFSFDLEGLSRIVDVAYVEGKISELTADESYADDAEKVGRLGAYQTQLQNAMPVDFVEVVD